MFCKRSVYTCGMAYLHLKIDQGQHDEIARAAKSQGLTIAAFVRQAALQAARVAERQVFHPHTSSPYRDGGFAFYMVDPSTKEVINLEDA